MARIRTIKPEFPQSESMGRVSREARLTFIMLWTLADDAGRLRGNSRMLASLLFPYDADAPALIDQWLGDLVKEGCITRYTADGGAYVEINNWLEHQKIDKPSKSKIPASSEASRIVENVREPSSEDLRTKDQGPKEHGGVAQPREWHPRYSEVREKCEALLNNPRCHVWGRVNVWLEQGADPEQDIYPVLKARKDRWRSGDLGYFDHAISDAVATRTKPMPAGQSRAAGNAPPEINIDLDSVMWAGRINSVRNGTATWNTANWGPHPSDPRNWIPADVRETLKAEIAALSKQEAA